MLLGLAQDYRSELGVKSHAANGLFTKDSETTRGGVSTDKRRNLIRRRAARLRYALDLQIRVRRRDVRDPDLNPKLSAHLRAESYLPNPVAPYRGPCGRRQGGLEGPMRLAILMRDWGLRL
jgi:hypothetical protein